MACIGHNPNYSSGNATCSSHRDACASNRVISLSGDFGTTGQKINASDVETLRASIVAELVVWNAWNTANSQGTFAVTDPGTINSTVVINHTNITQLNNDLSAIVNYTATSNTEGAAWTVTNNGTISDPGQGSKATGDLVTGPNWTAILSSYNIIRQDCICNSDCHCNTVCTCYGNCGCNYSDARLKENIEFIETNEGLNVYSYTYLWDKTKTYIGVMAQELLGTKYESALGQDSNGYYFVDYSQLPVTFKRG